MQRLNTLVRKDVQNHTHLTKKIGFGYKKDHNEVIDQQPQ